MRWTKWLSAALSGALRSKSLINRRVDRADRRKYILTLSARGKRIYLRIVPLAQSYERQLLAGLSAKARAGLAKAWTNSIGHLASKYCNRQVGLLLSGYTSPRRVCLEAISLFFCFSGQVDKPLPRYIQSLHQFRTVAV